MENLKPLGLAGGNFKCLVTVKTSWEFNPASPLLGVNPRELKTCLHKNTYTNGRFIIVHNSYTQTGGLLKY